MIAIGVGMSTYGRRQPPNRRCLNPACRRPTVRGKRSCERKSCRVFARETFRRWEAHKTRTLRRLGGLCTRSGCKGARMPGRTICEAHQWRAEPCPCGGKVPYREGLGPQRRFCSDACRAKYRAKPEAVELSDELRAELEAMVSAAGVTGPAKRNG